MEISDDLLCLYSASIEQDGDTYLIEVPTQELQLGNLEKNEICRVAVIESKTGAPEREHVEAERQQPEQDEPEPPVQEGDVREIEIEDIGDQGDGIGRIERGYVVIVPDTEPGDQVTVEMEVVKQRFAIGQVEETTDRTR